MRILCTGAAGFVGSNICNALLKNPAYSIHGVDNFSFGSTENINIYSSNNWEFLKEDFNGLRDIFTNKFDILIHCATSNIIYAQTHPLETVINNGLNTIKLFEKFKGKIIYLSTSSVYNNAKIIPTLESSQTHCVNAYDTSKLIAEMYLKERRYYTTLRLNNTYGVNQRPNNPYCGVLGKFIECAIKDKPMTIFGNGEHTRSYTYVSDVVSAVLRAVELPPCNTEINVGSDEEISSIDLCKLVWKCIDRPAQYNVETPRSIDTIKRRALNISKAHLLLGWKPMITLEEGIKKTIAWQREVR